VFIFIVTSPAN